MNIEDFKLFSRKALLSFLSLRKKNLNGSNDELIARAFSCYEENVDVDPTMEHRARIELEEYEKKLKLDGDVLPDPLDISVKGWLGEVDGMKSWPKIYLSDIISFYKDTLQKKNLAQELNTDYKNNKAYNYFANIT